MIFYAQEVPNQKFRRLTWAEIFDDDENSIWEAPSAFLDGEDGAPFMWRLKQRLANSRIEWYCASDPELVDGLPCDFWPNLGDALTACDNANDCIIHECSEGGVDETL
jgi:hypothetical protein